MGSALRAPSAAAAGLAVALVIVASGCSQQTAPPGGVGSPPIQAPLIPGSAVGVVTDATSVYWTVNDDTDAPGKVMKCTAADCKGTVVTLASHQSMPVAVAVDDARVYWTTGEWRPIEDGEALYSALLSCPIGGGPATTMTSGQGELDSLAVDARNIYWSWGTSGGESVFMCPKAGCEAGPTLLWNGPEGAADLTADGTGVYWRSGPKLLECPATGCSGGAVTLVSNLESGVTGLALDANDIYWTTPPPWSGVPSTLQRCAKNDCAATAVTLASGRYSWMKVVSDESSLYWTDTEFGSVLSCPKSGCAGGPVTLASGGGTALEGSTVAVNASTVYWTTLAGLMRAPK